MGLNHRRFGGTCLRKGALWRAGVMALFPLLGGLSLASIASGGVRPIGDGELPCSPVSEFVAPVTAVWKGESAAAGKGGAPLSTEAERKVASAVESPRAALKSAQEFALQNEALATVLDTTSDPDAGDSQERDVLDPEREVCSRFNPEFGLRSGACCPKRQAVSYDLRGRRRRARGKGPACGPLRAKASYCSEMTPEQQSYWNAVESGEVKDVLARILQDSRRQVQQSWCSVSDGFLAWGRPVLPTPTNRLIVKNPERCVNFGTDPLVAAVEWTGREISKKWSDPAYQGVRLVVGHVSAPRGGCIPGRRGGRGHSSHTSGRDVDLAFLDVKAGRASSEIFATRFNPEENWWLIRRIFENPYACVKVMFLDKRHIRTLAKWIGRHGTESDLHLWSRVARYVQHVSGHRNHLHVRVGDGPGAPGCVGADGALPWSPDLDEDEASPEGGDETVVQDDFYDDGGDDEGVDAAYAGTELPESDDASDQSIEDVVNRLKEPVRDVASLKAGP